MVAPPELYPIPIKVKATGTSNWTVSTATGAAVSDDDTTMESFTQPYVAVRYPPNRHERRKAASLERRRKRCLRDPEYVERFPGDSRGEEAWEQWSANNWYVSGEPWIP